MSSPSKTLLGSYEHVGVGQPCTLSKGPAQPKNPVVVLSLLIFMGFCFGFLFERSHVYEPSSIRLQFVFRCWIMLKMFMGAVAGGCLSFYYWEKVDKERFESIRECRNKLPMPWAAVALGSGILGAGMVVAGACPGMVLPQVGTGVDNCLFTLCGGFAGALLHNIALWLFAAQNMPGLGVTAAEKAAVSDYKMQYADLRWGLPFDKCAILFGIFCCLFCLVTEILIPYKKELLAYGGGRWHDSAWPPSLCGLGIGLINFGAVYVARASMGSSTAYAQLTGRELLIKSSDADPLVSSVTLFLRKYWQVPYLATSVGGAYVSGVLSGNVPSETPGIPSHATAFIGGMMMLFGSRVGGGCTSGHGIAGMPLLNLKSTVGVCGMFGVGIIVAVAMDESGELEL